MTRPARPRIGVLTTGGDCPGLNAALARLAGDASRRGVDLVGIRDGFVGLQHAGRSRKTATLPLPRHEDATLSRRGGTALGSIRASLKQGHGTLERAVAGVERLGLDGLVVIGGNGGLASAVHLADAGVAVAGVPKTIDNDVAGTDTAIGFATAVDTGVRLLDQLDDTATSHGTRFLIEVMGRRCGALTAAIGEAAAVDGVILPEATADLDDVRVRLTEGHGRARLVVAEGAWVGGLGEQPRSRSGHTKVGGVVDRIADALDGSVRDLRTITFGHLLRGGTPNAADRLLAQHSATCALDALLDGQRRSLVAVRSGVVAVHPLDAATTATRHLDRDAVTALGHRLVGRAR